MSDNAGNIRYCEEPIGYVDTEYILTSPLDLANYKI